MTKYFAFIVSILFSLNELSACECANFETEEMSNLEYEVRNNDWIGIGTIISANRETHPAIYEVQIRILYKGSNTTTTIQTGLGGPDCGFLFEINEEYIIYGTQLDQESITTNSCSRTNNAITLKFQQKEKQV